MTERVLIERKTKAGVTVQLVDRGVDDFDEQRWETICVDHGGVCSHDTRALAYGWLSHPDEWCEECMYGPGTLEGKPICQSCGEVAVEPVVGDGATYCGDTVLCGFRQNVRFQAHQSRWR